MCVYICIWTCVNIYVYVCIYMEFHGQRNLVGYSSWGPKELDMTQWLMHTCIHMLLLFSCCCVRLFETPWTAAQQASLSSPSPRACSNSCPLSHWYHPTISSSVVPFSSGLQSFPASRSFPMTQLFASGGQSIRLSTSASGFPMNIQDWFPLGLTSSISLLSKWLSRVFSITEASILQHSAFLWSNSHMLFNMLSWFVILCPPKSNHYIYIYTHTHVYVYVYICNWITLLYTWNYQNIINRVHFN